MDIQKKKLKQLKPSSFKAYHYLKEKAGEGRVIEKFSIRSQAKEWANDPDMNLVSSKDTLKTILTELESAGLIVHDLKKRTLTITKFIKTSKTVQVKTLENGDGFIDLEEFKEIVDITKVDSYKLKEVGEKSLSIEFFDKDGNKLKTK